MSPSSWSRAPTRPFRRRRRVVRLVATSRTRQIVQDRAGHLATITERRTERPIGSTCCGRTTSASTAAVRPSTRPPSPTASPASATTRSTHLATASSCPRRRPPQSSSSSSGQPDGDTSSGRGAIVYDHRATSATFNELTTSQSDFYLHQHANIPSRGSAAFQFAYVQAFTQDTVNSLARLSKRRFNR